MKIKVTQEHIDKGVKNCVFNCPVAIAATEAFGKPTTANYHTLLVGGKRLHDLPRKVKNFILRFDQYGNAPWVKPFEFEVGETPRGSHT